MSSSTVTYSQLSDKEIPLGILVAVFSVIAITLVQYTKRIRKIPAYLKSNFSTFKSIFDFIKTTTNLQLSQQLFTICC